MKVGSFLALACAWPFLAFGRWKLGLRPQRRGELSLTCMRFAVLVDAESKQRAALCRLAEGLAHGTCRMIMTPPVGGRRRILPLAILHRAAELARLLRTEGVDTLVTCTESPVEAIALFVASRLLGCRFGTFVAEHPAERKNVVSERMARAIETLIAARVGFLLAPNEIQRSDCRDRYRREATLVPTSPDVDRRVAQGKFVDALRLVNLPEHLRVAPPAPGPGKLRIAILTAYDILGIQANGFLLHKYFHKQGHDSRMLVHVKMSLDEAVFEIGTPLQYRINRLASLAERAVSTRAILSTLGRDVAAHPKMADADIVNVQLIHGSQFFSLLGLPRLTRMKRVVLSIHDMFLQTGHCVQAIECERWRTGCGACPDLVRPFRFLNDTTAFNWKLKKSIFDRCNLDLIVGSPWMKRRVEQSPLLARFPVHLIPFGIDDSVFSLADKKAARSRLGIPTDAHVIAFRSQPDGHHMFKGTQYVEAALAKYSPSRPTWLVTLDGVGGLDSIRHKYRFVELGWINDQGRVAEALSAADLFLMPSTAESFGLMAVESMACGTPVVAFEGSALPETIDAPRSGIAVPRGDSDALARAIEDCLGNPARLAALRESGLRHVANNHRFNAYGDRHLELFARLANGD